MVLVCCLPAKIGARSLNKAISRFSSSFSCFRVGGCRLESGDTRRALSLRVRHDNDRVEASETF